MSTPLHLGSWRTRGGWTARTRTWRCSPPRSSTQPSTPWRRAWHLATRSSCKYRHSAAPFVAAWKWACHVCGRPSRVIGRGTEARLSSSFPGTWRRGFARSFLLLSRRWLHFNAVIATSFHWGIQSAEAWTAFEYFLELECNGCFYNYYNNLFNIHFISTHSS